MSMQLPTQRTTAVLPIPVPLYIAQNQHMERALADYMNARKQVRNGLLGNASRERERLRAMYRLLAGKNL